VLACTLDTEVVPDVTEININSVVLRKGFLNFMEETSRGWIKRWVVSDVSCFRVIMKPVLFGLSFGLPSAGALAGNKTSL